MSAENRFTLEDILAEQRRAREAAAEGAEQAEPEAQPEAPAEQAAEAPEAPTRLEFGRRCGSWITGMRWWPEPR